MCNQPEKSQILRCYLRRERDTSRSPKSVEEIKSLPNPANVTELQKVLGIITYMAPFIPRLSDLTANIREPRRKDAGYEWNNSHQKSLQEIKDLICKEMLLRYYDPFKKSIVQVDASSRGLGAALIQESKPIAFASKSLTETKQCYANIEREVLAVVFGCERFRTYIYGCSFEVESDHKPLEMICLKNLTAAPPRLHQTLLRLQEYDLIIKYWPGKEMLQADGLFRLPNKKKKKPKKS